ncbi:MAG: hypothetical protein ACI81Y_002428 [Glaciecola sp.]|jgi:hypothetical protein
MNTIHQFLSKALNLFYPNPLLEEQKLRSWGEITAFILLYVFAVIMLSIITSE